MQKLILITSSHSIINSWVLCREARDKAICHAFILFLLCCLEPALNSCTLMHRNHIQSNMLDRLLQLVQLYQYQDEKIPFLMAISNVLMGTDVVIDDLSRRAYSAMGFFTEAVTQDQETTGGFFVLTNYLPIPIIQYDDSFTWHT